MYLHINIPRKYRKISGTANATMLVTSAGVRIIEATQITKIAIRQLLIYASTVNIPSRSRNSITSGN